MLPENISVIKSAGLENEQGDMEISSHVKQFTGMRIIQMEKSLSLHRIPASCSLRKSSTALYQPLPHHRSYLLVVLILCGQG
ncbi:MAG: hypothetical protein ACLQDI_03105, partial [Syntrophobacteraceae bacterium]